MNSYRFESPRRHIARAQKHINDLNRTLKAWLKRKPHKLVIDPHHDGIHEVHKLRLKRQIPGSFESIAADAVFNLRASLDQATFAVSRLPSKPHPRRAYFPIASSPDKLEEVIRNNCRDIPKDILTFIRSFKPYKGGNGFLWALSEACNASKHKIVAPVAVRITGVHINEFRSDGSGHIPQMEWDSTANEMVLFVVRRDSHLKYNIDFPFTIGFYDVDSVAGEPIVKVLRETVGIVSSILDGLEAEANRLGIFSSGFHSK